MISVSQNEEESMEIILFLIYTTCVFQAGRAEGEKRSPMSYWAAAWVLAIIMGYLVMRS